MKTPIRIEDFSFLVDADCELICKTESATYQELMHIVKCVNQHDVLVECAEVLKEARGTMQVMCDQIEQMQGMFDDTDGTIQDALEAYADMEVTSRHALAKLEKLK